MEKKKKIYSVVIESGLHPIPAEHELKAAYIIAEHFKSDLVFLRRGINTSPDFLVKRTNQIWELKSPKGNGKRTIANNLRNASHQSSRVILDLSRCKMNNRNAISRINGFLASADSTIKELVVIDKNSSVLTFL
ncbi:hypothetical protein IJ101_02300 [Candidatus Saccharibacteria bacterium]|nr:hypothetical protein [Candidatus Saccharibacteria bacterium]